MSIVATPASETADSYLTVADADALAAADIGPEATTWLGLDNQDADDLAVKEASLKRATREIDAYVATGWPPYDADQALVFPRDIDGATVPRKIVLATYQQAVYILENKHALAAMNAHRSNAGSVDPEDSYGTDPAAGPSIIAPMAQHYLSGFRVAPRSGKGSPVRSVRVASGFPGTW